MNDKQKERMTDAPLSAHRVDLELDMEELLESLHKAKDSMNGLDTSESSALWWTAHFLDEALGCAGTLRALLEPTTGKEKTNDTN